MNALVVEQAGENRDLLSPLLEHLGFAHLVVDWPYRGIDLLRVQRFDVCIINVDRRLDLRRFLRILRTESPDTPIVFMSEKASRQHYNEVLMELRGDHLISKEPHNAAHVVHHDWLTHTIRRLMSPQDVNLSKLLPQTKMAQTPITGTAQKEEVFSAVEAFARSFGLRDRVIQNILHLCDELMMNVIFNAPHSESGAFRYRHLPRDATVTLAPYEQGWLEYAFDGQYFGLSGVDLFGTLTIQTVKEYLTRSYREYQIPQAQAGGGMGFLNMLTFSSYFEVFVIRGQITRVSVLLNVKQGLREVRARPRSMSLVEFTPSS